MRSRGTEPAPSTRSDLARRILLGGQLCPAVAPLPGDDTHTLARCTIPSGQGAGLAVSINVSGQARAGRGPAAAACLPARLSLSQ
jgi:hypothetical protein